MYKLNIKRGYNKRYEAIVKRLFFNKLWLVVAREECDTKNEAKQLYRQIAY